MFGSLRKKLNNVIQEGLIITENLQQQYRQNYTSAPSSSATTPTVDESIHSNRSSSSFSGQLPGSDVILPSDVNIAAGCNLLAKYEDAWKLLHDTNEKNATNAAEVAIHIEQIGQRTTALHVDMTDLVTCLSGIPALVEKLQESLQTLGNVSELSATIETELERLEDLCEECELQEFILNKQCELSQFQQMKMVELESYRQCVAAKHQEKIREHEQNLRRIQRERQAVFDDAFRGDIAEYKSKGALTKIQKEEVPPTFSLALEEVVLEDANNKDALEEFLNG